MAGYLLLAIEAKPVFVGVRGTGEQFHCQDPQEVSLSVASVCHVARFPEQHVVTTESESQLDT